MYEILNCEMQQAGNIECINGVSLMDMESTQYNLHRSMSQEANNNNVINNYKGVMLCSRPNEKKSADVEKPFCPRVVPGEQLGINPIKKEVGQQEKPKNKAPTVLEKHKQWLNQFKNDIVKTKEELEEKQKKEDERFRKIREQGEADRERAKKMKEEYNQTATQVLNVLDEKQPPSKKGELTLQNLRKLDAVNSEEKKSVPKGEQFKKKKGQKPTWALTKQQVQQTQDKQVDDLLDFFEHTEVNDYSQNEEIKTLLVNLKEKIEKMKEEENWKQKQTDKLKRAKDNNNENQDAQDDKYSQFHVANSEGKSVASEKTQKKLEQLRNKKNQQQEWDKFTTSQKSSLANVEEKIAKNLADEVLRNYPNMKGVHSNVSIRKLLEAEAARVMNEPILRPVITTVMREKQPMNANTLPYLHRNPAI